MPQLILLLFKGHPGVGKSTLARQVCRELQWPLIDKDDARDSLQTLPAPLLESFDANQLAYDIMFSFCRTQLSLGLSVAVDCPFARVQLYDRAAAVAQQCAASVALIDCIPGDEQLWRQRLEARAQQQAGSAASHKPESWQQLQQLLQRYDGCWTWSWDGSRPQPPHYLQIDTTAGDASSSCQAAVQFVRTVARVGSRSGSDLMAMQLA